jgi:hypothetical protein
LYANVEQPDKTFLRNHDLWVSEETWLYKQGDIGPPELKWGEGDSPTFEALYYRPFAPGGPDPPAGYETQMQNLIDMDQMLTVGAVNVFTVNPDELLSKGKNFFCADYEVGAAGGQRLYFPWDLDAVFKNTASSIYGDSSDYQRYIVNAPAFRDQYNQIMLDLLDGPFAVAPSHDFLNELEAILTPWLLADPYSVIGNTPEEVAGHFDNMRQWMADRHANVFQQVQDDLLKFNTPVSPEPSTLVLLFVALLMLLARRVQVVHCMRT